MKSSPFGVRSKALTEKRDIERGHLVFKLACAICHRLGDEGHDVGPDLIGHLGMTEEALLKEILLPNERLRPGFETVVIEVIDGNRVTGILKEDGATSLTLVLPGGVEHRLLRKDVKSIKRLTTSLMPSFADGLSPSDLANLLAWLKSGYPSKN